MVIDLNIRTLPFLSEPSSECPNSLNSQNIPEVTFSFCIYSGPDNPAIQGDVPTASSYRRFIQRGQPSRPGSLPLRVSFLFRGSLTQEKENIMKIHLAEVERH